MFVSLYLSICAVPRWMYSIFWCEGLILWGRLFFDPTKNEFLKVDFQNPTINKRCSCWLRFHKCYSTFSSLKLVEIGSLGRKEKWLHQTHLTLESRNLFESFLQSQLQAMDSYDHNFSKNIWSLRMKFAYYQTYHSRPNHGDPSTVDHLQSFQCVQFFATNCFRFIKFVLLKTKF